MDYQTFLESKKLKVLDAGKPCGDVHPALFQFQRDIVRWAVRKGRAAIFADVGLGKTVIYCEWARQIAEPTLILTPLAVAQQTVDMARDLLGMDIRYVRDMAEVDFSACLFYVTNYEMLDHFDAAQFRAVVLDECFAADTPIDCIDANGAVYQKSIQHVRQGDLIVNASGIDVVSDVHRREVKYAIKVTVGGNTVISSPNHPYFTQRGWVGAQDLQPGDAIVTTDEAVRMVWRGLSGQLPVSTQEAVLQSVLFSEMAYESTGTPGESSHAGSGGEARTEKSGMASVGKTGSTGRTGTDSQSESDVEPGKSGESLPHIESDEPCTFRAWGQWDGIDDSTIKAAGGTRTELAGGISFVTGKTNTGLSDTLQTRFSEQQSQNRYRSGWTLAPLPERTGQQERSEAGFIRVDGIEVLELGHPELDRYRDADGKLYFYDIGATRHPSFSIDGMLVHNSSILKQFSGKTKVKLISTFKNTPYKLACTATPAPNDLIEIGNHADFLGVLSSRLMTSIFFAHDSQKKKSAQKVTKYHLKKHAVNHFYEWLASWAVALRKPSDLGYDDTGYELPELHIEVRSVDGQYTPDGMLPGFAAGTISAVEAKKVRRATIESRAGLTISEVASSSTQAIIWTELNDEAEYLHENIAGSFNLHGSLAPEAKVQAIQDFVAGKIRVLITKQSIAGAGVNLQQCADMVMFGLNYSWEQFYQAIGRIYRFGQKAKRVNVTIIISQQEQSIYDVIERKGIEAKRMTDELIKASAAHMQQNIRGEQHSDWQYSEGDAESPSGKWKLLLGDSCQRMAEIADNSVHLSVYSPPFGGTIYIYSATERDLGNSKTNEEFLEHYRFIVREKLRVTMPGRYTCVHIQDTKLYANRNDGNRGLYPLSDMLTALHLEEGWNYRARITIDKNPQAVATRNHDNDLLFITGQRDGCDLAPMNTDYLLVFEKPGKNPVPVKPYDNGEMSEDDWIAWARACWYDIRETDVLNVKVAASDEDEKHLCPLQLGLIERCIKMWSNPGETVFSPFAGIGSELYEAVHWKRHGLGCELKPEYHRVAVRNLETAEIKYGGRTLFDELAKVQASALPETIEAAS